MPRMSRRTADLHCAILVLVTASGCTFLDRFDRLRGDGTAPSSPVIHVEPAAPITTDVLRVVVDTASVDPLGLGEPTLEVVWTEDGGDSAEGVELVASHTSKGQRWTVTVTPRVGDRVGAPVSASVDIANAPPVLRAASFNHYRPRLDDALEVRPSAAYDPDGDALSFSYEWRRGEVPVAGESSSTIVPEEAFFVAGDAVSVVVVASDGEDDSAPLTLGPVPVVGAGIAWRPLTPDRLVDDARRAFQSAFQMVYDSFARRALYFVEGNVWERPIGTGGRYGLLEPSGSSDVVAIEEGTTLMDEANRRVIVVHGTVSLSLELSPAGSERWVSLTTVGAGPTRACAVAYDAPRDRFLFRPWNDYAGFPVGSYHALTIRGETATWTELGATGYVPDGLEGAVWLEGPEDDVLHLVGGRPAGGATSSDVVYRAEIDDDTIAFEQTSLTLPANVAYGGATFDEARGRHVLVQGDPEAYYAGGELQSWSVSDDPARAVWAIDPDSFAATELSDGSGAPASADVDAFLAPVVGIDDGTGDVVVLTGLTGVPDVAAVREGEGWVAVDVQHVHYPSAFRDAYGAELGVDGVGFLGSVSELGFTGGDTAWAYSFVTARYERIAIAPDATHGAPSNLDFPESGGRSLSSSALLHEIVDDGGGALESWLWSLETWSGSPTWVLEGVLPAADLETFGARHVYSTCAGGGWKNYYVGVDSEDDALMIAIACSAGVCTPAAASTGLPATTRAAAIVDAGAHLVHFGGSALTPPNTVRVNSDCPGPSSAWTTVTPAPDPMHGLPTGRADARFAVIGEGEVLMFGGSSGGTGAVTDEAWLLAGSGTAWAWQRLTSETGPGTRLPPRRSHHLFVWDAVRRRALVIGGQHDGFGNHNDVWELHVPAE